MSVLAKNNLSESNMARRHLTSFFAVLSLMIAGCGGWGDGSQAGVFLDASSVEGLQYQTPTRSGTTDRDGKFRYMPGEQIVFSVGSIEVGRAIGSARITTFDLAGISAPDNEIELELLTPAGRGLNRAINLTTFFQTIDEDTDTSNGISIPQALSSIQARSAIMFALPVSTFKTHPTLLTFMGQARAAGVWGGARPIKNSSYAMEALQRGLGLEPSLYAKSEFRVKSSGLDDSVTSYSYDEKGQLVEELLIDPSSEIYQKTVTAYNAAGHRIRVATFTSPDTLLNEILFTYDTNGNEIKAVTVHPGLGTWSIETIRDVSGNPIEVTTYDDDTVTSRSTNAYDDLGRLVKSESFDGNGQRIRSSDSDYRSDFKQTTFRQFDSTQNLSLTIQMSYDETGELIKEAYYEPLGQLLGSRHITRDSNGNMISEEFKDGAGLSQFKVTFTYDQAGRQSALKNYDNDGVLTGSQALSYDTNGRLVGKRFNDITNGVIIDQIISYKPVRGWASFFAGFVPQPT